MKNPLSVAATVLKPYDSASLYEKEGQMKLQPLLEKKQKMQQAENEFANVMAEIDKYSSDVWEQDWQQVSKMKDEFLDNAARVYEDAHFNGRDLSITERYQMQKGLGALAQKATMSKANKTFYEKTAYQIMTNPDKYDVEASMYLLNKGYKEGQLGARSVQNFMVPRFDEQGFLKNIPAPSITKKWDTPTAGGISEKADIKQIEANVWAGLNSNSVAREWFVANYPTPEAQQQKVAQWVEIKKGEVDTMTGSSTKTPPGTKVKVPLVRTTEDLGNVEYEEDEKGKKRAVYTMTIAGTKNKVKAQKGASVVRISPEGTLISTTKGKYYIQGVFKDAKTGKLFAYGNNVVVSDGGALQKGDKAIAVPYGEAGAGIESATGYTRGEIEKAFGGQQTGGGVGSKYKGQ